VFGRTGFSAIRFDGSGNGGRIMKATYLWRCLGWLLLFFGSVAAGAADDDLRSFTEESRKLAGQMLSQVRGELLREVERSGPIRAINVCKYSAPEIASDLSRQSGARVSRVALRPRNPALGDADVWEQKVLLDFEKRFAKGEKADALEFSEVVVEPAGKSWRYMKAIPMAQACMPCHGPVSQISEGVRAQLASEYPNDRAVDYQLGQVRGAVSIKKPLRD
jgi:hypothetical protein